MFSHDKPNPKEPLQINTYAQAYHKAYRLATRRPYCRHLLRAVQHKSKPRSNYVTYREELERADRGFVDGYFMGILSK